MFKNLLEKIARSLDKADIPYMVIGGQALLLHGEPRLTRDIDITLGISTDQLKQLLSVVEKIRLKPLVDPWDFTVKTMVLPCQDPGVDIRVDFIFSFTPYEAQAIQHAHRVSIGRSRVRFASPEDLIIHKIFAGRPRDLEDVKSVLLKTRDLDKKYIRSWLKEFSKSLNKPLVQSFNAIVKEAD